MTMCYLGLGSNLNNPSSQLTRALKSLKSLPRSYLKTHSHVYHTKPLGPKAQPDYLNMVVGLQTTLSPHVLLSYCQRIEKEQHRIRKKKWGARTIDIDVLLYGNHIINLPHFQVPHPGMLVRDFVLIPLIEVAPELNLPNGQSLKEYNDNPLITLIKKKK